MIRFKIVDTFNLTSVGAVILAECIDSLHDFSLTDSAMLGDAPIKPVINLHRKLEGTEVMTKDFYAFQLKDNSDKDKFQKGEILLLKP